MIDNNPTIRRYSRTLQKKSRLSMSEVFKPMHGALAQLEGTDRAINLLTAEAIIESDIWR